MALKIAFINNKGGSAKTTTLVNLAGAISKKMPNKKILIIDGDAQGNASTSFKIDSSKMADTIYDVFMGNIEAESLIVPILPNIDIIPANTTMNFLEFDVMERYNKKQDRSMFDLIKSLSRKQVDFDQLSFAQFQKVIPKTLSPTSNYFNMLDGKLDEVDNKYDIILFDTPPELKAVTSSVLAVVDKAIIPFEPDVYAIDGIINILNRVSSIQEDFNPNLEIAGILATKVKGNTKLHADIRASVMKFCMKNNIHYFQSEIPNSIRYASSIAKNGLPTTLGNPDNPFSQAYYKLLEELIDIKVIK